MDTIQNLLTQINYLDVLKILTPVLAYYIVNKKINSYNLHRNYKPKNIQKVLLPPELKTEYTDVDINKIANTTIGETLIKFTNIMIENFSSEDLTFFYNNINALKISSNSMKMNLLNFKKNFIHRQKITGYYDAEKNKITIYENGSQKTIFHELLHMASSTSKDGIYYSGFSQVSTNDNPFSLGIGITEGYTELLNKRYFGSDNDKNALYELETIITDRLEIIVGKEKMERLYLTANLPGLIEELKQYSTEEEIMEFISNTDLILQYTKKKKITPLEEEIHDNCIKNVNKFLIKAYSKKLLQNSQQKNIPHKQLYFLISEYVSSLVAETVNKNGVHTKVLSKEDIMECLESVFGESYFYKYPKK